MNDMQAVTAAANMSTTMATGSRDAAESVIAALRTVYDPEIPVNIYDLGLVYRISHQGGGAVEIDMTLTAPGCPVASEIVRMVEEAVSSVDGVQSVKVTLVFEPPWDKSRMSEDVALELGLL